MWLLVVDIFKKLESAAKGILTVPESLHDEFDKSFQAVDSNKIRGFTKAGNQGEISVKGVLTREPNFFAFFFGGGNTVFSDIVAGLQAADSDPEIENIIMRIDSPGGEISGLFDTLAAIQATSKPVTAIVDDMAASAAFAIASQADEIIATNEAALVGSVGVVQTFNVDGDIVSITSTDAPNKRPDVTTEEGRAVVRAELDSLHALFVESIADGRNTTVDKVNSDFGRGGVLVARDAIKVNMIDSIQSQGVTDSLVQATGVSGNQEVSRMDKEELKAKHPSLYAEVLSEGVAQERDRACAHLVMGESSGAMKTAINAVKEGEGMTTTLQAEYMAAGMNHASLKAQGGEDDEVGEAADDTSTPDESATPESEAIVAGVEKLMGVK